MPAVWPTSSPVTSSSGWHRRRLLTLALACAALFSGCTFYHAAPLSTAPERLTTPELMRVQIDASRMSLPELRAHRFDPSDGLDIEEVAMLAVVNNPALRLARDDLRIASAQAFSAGLLPDPQLGIAKDFPGAIGTTSAFSYGLSMDIMAIVARGANKASADATVQKTDLGLLWQEWQTVAQARQLFVKARLQDETLPLLQQLGALTQQRYLRMHDALHDGNLTADSVTAALTAWTDANRQMLDTQRAALQTRQDLNALLGLAPDVQLQLTGDVATPLPDFIIDDALTTLPERRPDLLALQAGYEAQEQKYRAAILGQFPSLTVGFVRSRDTTPIYTSGFQINLSLPIFNRNRGNIAIENATRARLRHEYQDRIAQAYADVARLREDNRLIAQQIHVSETALPGADAAAQDAQRAYAHHDIALGAYVDAQSAALTRRIDLATLDASLAEQRIGLQALLGSTVPDAYSSDRSPSAHSAQYAHSVHHEN